MYCHLCGQARKLIKAHIIPEAFFVAHRKDGKRPSRLISNCKGERAKKSPVGIYDFNILCGECDGKLGLWDEYGIQLFIKDLKSFAPSPVTGTPICFVRPEFDYVKLKLFVLSVLWRAHLTSQKFFERVQLGPYADALRDMIAMSDPGDGDDFCTVLSCFTLADQLEMKALPILDPHRERWQHVNAYRLGFGVLTAYVKVDQSKFGPSFRDVSLRPDQPLIVIQRSYEQSSERRLGGAIVGAKQNRQIFDRE